MTVTNVIKAPWLSSERCFHPGSLKRNSWHLNMLIVFLNIQWWFYLKVFLPWLRLRIKILQVIVFAAHLQQCVALKRVDLTRCGRSEAQTFLKRLDLSQLSVMRCLIPENDDDWVPCRGRWLHALGQQECCVCNRAHLHFTRTDTHKCNTKGPRGKPRTWICAIMLSKTTHTGVHKHVHTRP